jgi:hypothetical protein
MKATRVVEAEVPVGRPRLGAFRAGDIARPHVVRSLDRKAREKIRLDRRVATCRRPTSWPSRWGWSASMREP